MWVWLSVYVLFLVLALWDLSYLDPALKPNTLVMKGNQEHKQEMLAIVSCIKSKQGRS